MREYISEEQFVIKYIKNAKITGEDLERILNNFGRKHPL